MQVKQCSIVSLPSQALGGYDVLVASTDGARMQVEQAGLEFLSLGEGESEEEARCRSVAMGKSASSLQASMEVIIDISFGNA